MTKIAELTPILYKLFTMTAQQLAKETGFIQRQRKITGAAFAQTLVLGSLAHPQATRKQLHLHSLQTEMQITQQGLDDRFNEKAVRFMRALLEATLSLTIKSESKNVILQQFNGIYIADCTRLVWPELGIKLGVRWEIQRGEIQACLLDLLQNDQSASVIDLSLPPGALILADLGFFKLERFWHWNELGVYWVSRYKIGTTVSTRDGQRIDLLALLEQQDDLNLEVVVGTGKHAVGCRLLAKRLSEADYAKRLARLKEQIKDGRPISERQLAMARWSVYMTNIPDINMEQVHILVRTRWQIELLFKLWKSHGKILKSNSANPARQQCEGLAKLIGVLVAHWSLLVCGWELADMPLVEGLQLVRNVVSLLQRALAYCAPFHLFFDALTQTIERNPRPSKRRKQPLAYQRWWSLEEDLSHMWQ
jgi:hypothetical protein